MTETFIIKTYSYNELALMYFPGSSPKSASVQFKRWIDLNSKLQDELKETGYRNGVKILTPLQVLIIIYYLGFPFVEVSL